MTGSAWGSPPESGAVGWWILCSVALEHWLDWLGGIITLLSPIHSLWPSSTSNLLFWSQQDIHLETVMFYSAQTTLLCHCIIHWLYNLDFVKGKTFWKVHNKHKMNKNFTTRYISSLNISLWYSWCPSANTCFSWQCQFSSGSPFPTSLHFPHGHWTVGHHNMLQNQSWSRSFCPNKLYRSIYCCLMPPKGKVGLNNTVSTTPYNTFTIKHSAETLDPSTKLILFILTASSQQIY